jgi:uncharacterized protein (TIGR03437 family)
MLAVCEERVPGAGKPPSLIDTATSPVYRAACPHPLFCFIMDSAMLRATLLTILCSCAATAQVTSGWKLVWSDEFNQAAGSPPDPANWNYDLGGGGWGNGEAEVYTNSRQNVFQDGNGNLVIRAIRDASGNFTSARLQTGTPGASTHTTDLSWQYGRIVARIKLPFGQGIWPAFWMLGENIGTAGWPTCGEVDIMENFGTFNNNAAVNNGTAHGPGYSGGGGITKSYTMPIGQKVADDYHVYAIEWSPDSIEWFVDGASFHKVTPASLPSGAKWVYNAPFFILLNLAIGGQTTFLGKPDPSTPFAPQDMLVDYVRVYQSVSIASTTPAITPGRVVNSASYLGTLAPGALATLYGANLADAEQSGSGVQRFPTSLARTSVSVGGVAAPLIYISPTQINFQIPWSTVPGPDVEIKVTRDAVGSNSEPVTIVPACPSMFLSEFTNGVAWVTGSACPTNECAVQPGGVYQLWANGFGPKNGPSQDGTPAVYNGALDPLEVPGSPESCQLTIDGHIANVQYCGAAPGEIIDQLNFIYPAGVDSTVGYVDASLTIAGVTGRFRMPAPSGAGVVTGSSHRWVRRNVDE